MVGVPHYAVLSFPAKAGTPTGHRSHLETEVPTGAMTLSVPSQRPVAKAARTTGKCGRLGCLSWRNCPIGLGGGDNCLQGGFGLAVAVQIGGDPQLVVDLARLRTCGECHQDEMHALHFIVNMKRKTWVIALDRLDMKRLLPLDNQPPRDRLARGNHAHHEWRRPNGQR